MERKTFLLFGALLLAGCANFTEHKKDVGQKIEPVPQIGPVPKPTTEPEEFVQEQEDNQGRITKLVLPNGKNHSEIGSYSLLLPPNFLTEIPKTTIGASSPLWISLSLEVQDPSLIISGEIYTPRIQEGWSFKGPLGDTRLSNTYQIMWDTKKVQEIRWNNITFSH